MRVLSGKDRGKNGKVLDVFPKEDKVLVEGVNIRKRHRRAKKQGQKGQIVQVAFPIHFSNVMLVCPSCKKPQRTGRLMAGGEKIRVCRKCNAEIR